MNRYVEFVAVENTSGITDNYKYVKSIFNKLVVDGYVSTIAVAPGMLSTDPILECDEESTCFSINYNSEIEGKSNIWNLFFRFGTYDGSLQLQISISSDTYIITVEDSYLEKLKLEIKQIIIHDWKEIIWLIDEDSQCLSESIYPDLYSVENALRRLINSVMIKAYGMKWWELFVPYSIKEKHRSRLVGYKSMVPGFNNVDEKLMSIDIGDLSTILTLEKKKWDPQFEEELNSLLNGMSPQKPEKIMEILNKQMNVEISLWDQWFSKYLPASFKDDFKKFELYRNHIAHNKLIDRSAYRKIKEITEIISDNLKEAIKKAEADILSAEDKIVAEREREEYLQLLDECERENKKNDARVNIRNTDEIQELLHDAVEEVISFLAENLCFREDIEIQTGEYDEEGYTAFKVTSKINDQIISISVAFEINDEEGTESLATLQYGDKETYINYTNGEVEYDPDQGLYMPRTQDELSAEDIENAKESILEYINDITDIKGKAHEACYLAARDGDSSPIAEDVECEECGECEISVDEEFAPIGTCLNCGCKNNISMCERCGEWFNTDFEGEYEEDGVSLCQNCLDEFEEE